MNWYVDIVYMDGETGKMYCTTRQEARDRRRRCMTEYLNGSNPIMKATIKRVSN